MGSLRSACRLYTSLFPEGLEILRKKFMADVGFAGHGKRKDVPYASVGTVSEARGAGEAGDEE